MIGVQAYLTRYTLEPDLSGAGLRPLQPPQNDAPQPDFKVWISFPPPVVASVPTLGTKAKVDAVHRQRRLNPTDWGAQKTLNAVQGGWKSWPDASPGGDALPTDVLEVRARGLAGPLEGLRAAFHAEELHWLTSSEDRIGQSNRRMISDGPSPVNEVRG